MNSEPTNNSLNPTAAGPIGIFDSGLGGLSVWREIVRQFPHEPTLYVADQAHMPYGARSLEEVRAFCEGVTRFLLGQGAKIIVIACNSASAAALRYLRERFPDTPFVGMEPAVKPAVERTRRGIVGVIATQATFQGQLFAGLVDQYGKDARVLTQVGHGLAQAVEAGALDAPETEVLLRECLNPLLTAGIDHLVLGCTHYPFLRPAIERLVGSDVAVVDPAPAVARQTGRLLAGLGRQAEERAPGRHRFVTTGEVEAFTAFLARLVPGYQPNSSVGAATWQDSGLVENGVNSVGDALPLADSRSEPLFESKGCT